MRPASRRKGERRLTVFYRYVPLREEDRASAQAVRVFRPARVSADAAAWSRTPPWACDSTMRMQELRWFESAARARRACYIDLRNGAPECSRSSLNTIFGQAFCATSISETCEARYVGAFEAS